LFIYKYIIDFMQVVIVQYMIFPTSAVLEITLKTREFYSVRLPTQCMT
jgi:hypothetical protein